MNNIFPFLDQTFDPTNIKVERNSLREKYPDVNFKDEDIDLYDYISGEKDIVLIKEFVKQYNIKNLQVKYFHKDNEQLFKQVFAFDISVKEGRKGFVKSYLKAEKAYYLNPENHFNITLVLNDYIAGLKISEHVNEHFKVTTDSIFKMFVDLEINKLNDDIKNNSNAFFINKLFENYSEDEIIYKHPTGHIYYFKDCSITRCLTIYNTREDHEADYGENKVWCTLIKNDVVEPFVKYKSDYDFIKAMPKKSLPITLKQVKLELIDLCNYALENINKVTIDKEVYRHTELFSNLFQKQNVLIITDFGSLNSSYSYTYKDLFLSNTAKDKQENIWLNTTSITKKDKFIGEFTSPTNIPKNIQKDFFKFLKDIYEDDLDLNIFNKDLEELVNYLKIDDYDQNEELNSYSFDYYEIYKLNKYKIKINSSKYIKDQFICDLKIDSLEIYSIL